MGRVFNAIDAGAAEQLFTIIRNQSDGGPYHPGITRPAYSAVETAALRTLEEFAGRSGLRTYYDSAANVWFEQPNVTPDPAVWIGSHVDSVPQGGNYDGLAGVVAGLLVLRKIRERGHATPRQVRVAALRGEESAWFGVPYIGAKAFLGKLTKEDLARPFRAQGHASGEPLHEHMKNCGAMIDRVSRGVPCIEPYRIAEYWELHIEQGPILVDEEKPVGVVTSVRGNIRHVNIQIAGIEGHSGTVPRELRNDAVFAFAEFITALDVAWEGLLKRDYDLVVTSGIVETDATVHGITRIPGNVRFCLEWRSQHTDTLKVFARIVLETAKEIEALRGVTFVFDAPVYTAPARLNTVLAARAANECKYLDLPVRMMPSGAGHDAAIFANAGIDTGMIFVRNEKGSHNPHESMDIDDFMAGVEVLYKVVTADERHEQDQD